MWTGTILRCELILRALWQRTYTFFQTIFNIIMGIHALTYFISFPSNHVTRISVVDYEVPNLTR
jgi:hypothetical protein